MGRCSDRVVRRRAPGVDTRVADLEKHEFAIGEASWDLIAVCYYLQRDLFEPVKRGVKPGGVALVIVHMVEPGHEESRFSVQPGELAKYFEGWEILHYYEGKPHDPEHKRAVAEIVARTPTARHDHLLLGVEGDRVFAVGVEIAEEGVFPAGEGEKRHGRGDADVHAHHPRFDARRVFARSLPAGSENRSGVAEGRAIHQLDRFIERGNADDREHRSEDFLARDGHLGRDLIEDRRPQKASIVAAPVAQRNRALGDSLIDVAADALGVFGRDHREAISTPDLVLPDQQIEQGTRRVAHGNQYAARQTALARRAESRTDDGFDGLGHIGIGHHHHVILRAAQSLDAFPFGGSGRIDVLGDGRRTDERDRSDQWMVQ